MMAERFRVLFLEPFGGGSHEAFCRGWQEYSELEVHVLSLPAVHWKWRSRHSCLTLAQKTNELIREGHQFDVVFCTDMLDLAAWKGMVESPVRDLPVVCYFHENQLTYPVAEGERRDFHYGYSNILNTIVADETWFNSHFHRQEFASAGEAFLRRMPDHAHLNLFSDAITRSSVLYPGIFQLGVEGTTTGPRKSGPLRIGWVGRWEHDKNPEAFADAINQLARSGCEFELILMGQQFASKPRCLEELQANQAERIIHVGFAGSSKQYQELLRAMDVVVATANHEFFGIAVLEALALGAVPVLPDRLAYPELLTEFAQGQPQTFLYANQEQLIAKLKQLTQTPELLNQLPRIEVSSLHWKSRAASFDRAMRQLVHARR